MLSSIMADKNTEDNDIKSAPKLIQVIFQNCRGQVDQWVEPYLRITIECLQRTQKSSFRGLLIEVIADALYYNTSFTIGILQKFGVASEVFDLWFHMLQEVKKNGSKANFRREYEKKVCCLGLISLLALAENQLPAEALGRVFYAALELLVAFKDQVAESNKEDDLEDDMDGFQSDEDEDEDEMRDDVDEDDDGDEVDSRKLQKFAAQARGLQPEDEDDNDSDDDYSDDDEMQSPIDAVDPFLFFVETMKGLQASNPARFQNLMQTMDFSHQAMANGIAQYAEQRKGEIEKDRIEKAVS
ncbi:hypothetical protein AXF42_Ash020482 [Apostasia shenzhenica]|uniref:Importin beta-like SAD2 n=1 Tax=Apostasia shenzhenica TaxID=1088818 RepID=A0A2H9ZZ81_9ASPA|nr:hypothetical protein AXF42_Ash020482 [Apostasia shenzhenica]